MGCGMHWGQVREWSGKQESNEDIVLNGSYWPLQVHSLSFSDLPGAFGGRLL